MRYVGMPLGMWLVFGRSFRTHLTSVFGAGRRQAAETAAKARAKYREILAALPAFEKGDRFRTNIVSCAMLCAFLLSMEEKPDTDRAAEYYAQAMMTGPVRTFFRMAGKRKFTDGDIRDMRAAEARQAADRNPYSWNMEVLPYADGSGYEARFTRCGICTLMRELGLYGYVPAMCALDHTMAEAAGTYAFVRRYTLASGGPYCDCGYKKINDQGGK